jgi:hypothetical protein
MHSFSRRGGAHLIALALLLLVAGAASAAVDWPTSLSYTIGASTDETSRIQTSATLRGPIGPNLGLTLGGWWIAGGTNNRAFVGDAYVDYTKDPLYVAAGRKFVPFGPIGVLVSPGIWGGEVQYRHDRFTLQAISGTLAYTAVTGGTRFTYAGNRIPSDEGITAGRLAIALSDADSAVPATLGINYIDILDDTGKSADLSVDATKWLNLFGETADYDDVDAHAYGIRLSDQHSRSDPTSHTILVFYHRDIPVGFVPAAAGATQFFENQTGWVGGIYHQLDARRGIGVYADREEAILTYFGYVPL